MSLVSVIIPTFNRAKVLGEAISSVQAQSYTNVEIIVIDDGSTDNTQAVVSAFDGVKYDRIDHASACAARNRGIALASGDYLLFLDSDDVLYENAIEELAGALTAGSDYGAAYCGYIVTTSPGSVHSSSTLDKPSGNVFNRACTEHLCVVHSVLARKSAVVEVGGFDESLRQFEDWDLWIRVAAQVKFVFVPKLLVEYRKWSDGASALSPRVYDAGRILFDKCKKYYRSGMLTKPELNVAHQRFIGNFRDTFTALAFLSYDQKDYKTCIKNALKGFVQWPASILNRGVWAIIIRSLLRLNHQKPMEMKSK